MPTPPKTPVIESFKHSTDPVEIVDALRCLADQIEFKRGAASSNWAIAGWQIDPESGWRQTKLDTHIVNVVFRPSRAAEAAGEASEPHSAA